MSREFMIGGLVGILALGVLYGYCIGKIGKQRSWSGKNVKRIAGFPLMFIGIAVQIASIVSRDGYGYGYGDFAAAWARFPWGVMVSAGIFSMLIAAKVAYPGVPLAEVGKDNLSIR